MREMQALRSVITTRIELEQEAAVLSEKLPAERRELDRLTRAAQTYLDEVESLQRSGLKVLFLRITGRHEEQLGQAQRQAAKARAEMNSAQFLVDSAEGRLVSIGKALKETESDEKRFLTYLEEHFPENTDLSAGKKEVQIFQDAFELRDQIKAEMDRLNMLVEQAIRTHTHGDIQVSATGTRYNRTDHTLKQQCRLVEEQLVIFCKVISAYNDLAPQDLQDELEGPWTGKDAYLTEPLTDPELLGRLIGLQDWMVRLKRGWAGSTPVLKENQRQANNRLRYLLLSLYDQLTGTAMEV